MNKPFAFIIAVLLSANILGASTVAYAAGSAAFSVSASPTSMIVGSNTTFSLYENGDAVNVVTGTFTYDSSKLQFVSSSCAGSFSNTVSANSTTVSCYVAPGTTVSGSQKFANVTFSSVATGNASFTVTGSQIASAGANTWNGAPVSTIVAINPVPATSTPTPVQSTPTPAKSTPTPTKSGVTATTPVKTTSTPTPGANTTPTPTVTSTPTSDVKGAQASNSATPTPTVTPTTVVKNAHSNTPWIIAVMAILIAAAAAAYYFVFRNKVASKKS